MKVWVPQTARDIHTPEGRPAWDRPPTMIAEEVAATRMLGPDDGHRPFAWLAEGRYSELDKERALRGEFCLRCLHPLPEDPSTLGAYKRILRTPGFDIATRYAGYPGQELAKRRLMQGLCPVCGTTVSAEFAAALFAGNWDTEVGSEAWRSWV